MAKSMSKGRKVSRPALGDHATRRTRPPRPAYTPDAAPKVVGMGTLSRPTPRDKWAPKTDVPNRPGKVYDPN